MDTTLDLGGIRLEIVRKDIRNVHLTVHPPVGRVRIAAPARMDLDTIRVFAISKLGWIRQRRARLLAQERESPREYINRESHYVWGRRYLLAVVETDAPPRVDIQHRRLVLQVRPGSGVAARRALLSGWHRKLLRDVVPPLMATWERRLGVQVRAFFLQQMKTKWGSCNAAAGTIRLNTELATKPPECLEYILVHEMLHLLVPTHDARFLRLLDKHVPHWQHQRAAINRLPVRHYDWDC